MPTRCSPSSRATGVIVETRDAFEGKITSENDVPSELLEVPFLNPQCGPIFMAGAEKGDVLAVHIESMAPRRAPAPRHLLHDQGVRRAHRHLLHGDPQRAAAREGAQGGGGRGERLLERPSHAPLQAAHRHAELLAPDRFHQLAHAGRPWRQHGPAGHGARHDHLPAGARARRAALHPAMPTPARATARSAASPWSIPPRPRSPST